MVSLKILTVAVTSSGATEFNAVTWNNHSMLSKIWITFCLTWLVLRVAGGVGTQEQNLNKNTIGQNKVTYQLPIENS